jgi:hypothetical protein
MPDGDQNCYPAEQREREPKRDADERVAPIKAAGRDDDRGPVPVDSTALATRRPSDGS